MSIEFAQFDRFDSAVGNGGFAGGINWLDMVSLSQSKGSFNPTHILEGRRLGLRIRCHVYGYWSQQRQQQWQLGLSQRRRNLGLGLSRYARLNSAGQAIDHCILLQRHSLQLLQRMLDWRQ
jgi:hypothetical protein